MFDNKKIAIEASVRQMVVNAIQNAGYGKVEPPASVQAVTNTDGSLIYIVPLGDAMAVYTPEFATKEKSGVKFICF